MNLLPPKTYASGESMAAHLATLHNSCRPPWPVGPPHANGSVVGDEAVAGVVLAGNPADTLRVEVVNIGDNALLLRPAAR